MNSSYTFLAGLAGGPSIVLPFIFLGYRCILGAVACRVYHNRGRSGGFWWGFFLGAVGIIVQACRP